ncbi:hypothetical protein CJF31_00003434 [Rutstroemia sp. NJR-2017a BVV2]|nr:hypothetical protein CJF31_00003434 [Rutstroemia sp. NJR-2017a BVV2]
MLFQAMVDSEDTSSEAKDRAKHELIKTHNLRTDSSSEAKKPTTKHVYRSIYSSEKTDQLEKKLLFEEGAAEAVVAKDEDASRVYDFFGKTYQFYSEVFNRDSIDNKGLHMKGSVHYDDQPGPPGYDNAFWDGSEMAFGDGDGEIFGTFTKNLDVIGHELTHGVTQLTADLEYEYQSGALNESISDVFGSMIKQYFPKTAAADADWLIGEGIFLPTVENAPALRSMKAPGTAYDNPKIGKDTQPATMDGYADLDESEDGGGVHTNSGIPNHAFYLASVALGGYSWEKAGKVWYAALTDKSLKGVDTKKTFGVFAELTVKHAGSLFDEDTQKKVRQAWIDVKVLTADKGDDKDDL